MKAGQSAFGEGVEHAIVKFEDGRRVLVKGGAEGIEYGIENGKVVGNIDGKSEPVSRILAHTHPMAPGSHTAAPEDVAALERLRQQSSWIIPVDKQPAMFTR